MAGAALKQRTLVALIGDEDTVTGMLLAGIGHIDNQRKANFLTVTSKTPVPEIEKAFVDFTARKDVSIVLITQNVAELIRHVVDKYNKPIPSVLEIPSKDLPYDPSKDAIMKRAQKMFSGEDLR